MTSTARSRLARGGKMNVPRALYSFSGSFWSITRIARARRPAPRAQRARTREDRPDRVRRRPNLPDPVERQPVEQGEQVVDRVERHPHPADFPVGERMVGVEPHLRRQIERDREAGLAGFEQPPESRVRLARRAVARVHPHHPQLVEVARIRSASGVRIGPGRLVVPVPRRERDSGRARSPTSVMRQRGRRSGPAAQQLRRASRRHSEQRRRDGSRDAAPDH